MKFSLNIIFAFFLIFAVSCSGESNETGPVEQQEGQSPVNFSKMVTTQKLHIYGIDKMKYIVAERSAALQTSDSISVNGERYYLLEGINTQAGEELTITLTTISDLSAASMSHNWLLLKQNANASTFASASLQARENDYVAPEKMDLVITETGMVAPDESVTITFATPEEAGEYEYICTFPAHFNMGMRGTLYVME